MADAKQADPGLVVRPERPEDAAMVDRIHEAAFGRRAEADLVRRLRAEEPELVSLVAAWDDAPVGHILFSPASLEADAALRIAALAPMAVLPEHQGRGVGARLVRSGLAACRERGFAVGIVLGHPSYYPRFGFSPAWRHGIRCEYDVPRDAFLLQELREGALQGRSGLVRYARAFAEL